MEQVKKEKPKFYVLLHNIQKKNNFGTLLRSAGAFGVTKIFLIAKEEKKKTKILKSFNVFFGDQGVSKQLSYEVFFDLKTAKAYFDQHKISVCGIEITQSSTNIIEHPFKGDTVFILGNEGQGMHQSLKDICDMFVHISQFSNKTASLNVAVAGSIIFHHFSTWAKYNEVPMFGEKFKDVNEKKKIIMLDCKVHSLKKLKDKTITQYLQYLTVNYFINQQK